MFSSPLMRPAPTRLPPSVRRAVGRLLSGPPNGADRRHYAAVIFKVDRLGDFVLALGAIRALLNRFGERDCLLVISPLAEPVARHEFPNTALVSLPVDAPGVFADLWPLWRTARPRFAGIVAERRICLTHQRDVYKETALTWIRAREDYRLTRANFPRQPTADRCLDLLAHEQLLAPLIGAEAAADQVIPRFQSLSIGNNGRLLVCPFASRATRDLPADLVVAALKRWRMRSAAPIDVCATTAQLPAAHRLVTACGESEIDGVSLVMPPDVWAFIEMVAAAGAVLAADTAATHVAAAFDQRLCSVPGGGTFGLCAPWRRSDRQVVVQHEVSCYGCGWECHRPERYCLTHIRPDAIAAALPTLSPVVKPR